MYLSTDKPDYWRTNRNEIPDPGFRIAKGISDLNTRIELNFEAYTLTLT